MRTDKKGRPIRRKIKQVKQEPIKINTSVESVQGQMKGSGIRIDDLNNALSKIVINKRKSKRKYIY